MIQKTLLLLVLAAFTLTARADLDPVEQNYVDLMLSGDLRSLKRAAKQMHDAREDNREVLDVAAEVLLSVYPSATDRQIDTLSWLARAIGISGDGRYYDALSEVMQQGPHRKLRRHAKKALGQLGASSDGQYVRGATQIKTATYQ